MNRDGALCYLLKNNQVLLALIHYGPGDEKWNGISGYIEIGEDPKQGIIREIQEEIGVTVNEEDLKEAGIIKVNPELKLHVFRTNNWQGEPEPKEESLLKLNWFNFDNLPFDQMHEGDKNWLPKVLTGENI